MTPTTAPDYLRAARDVFRDHGGAVGVLRADDGRVCAVGAMEAVAAGHHINGVRATHALLESAIALYGCNVDAVNDDLGTDAVLHCYDHAIKTLEATA